MIWASTLETTVVVTRASCLLNIRPWAGLLLLLRWHKVILLLLLLLRWSNDPTPLLRGFLSGCSWSILNHMIPRCLATRGSNRCLSLLVSPMSQYEILLSDTQIHQLITLLDFPPNTTHEMCCIMPYLVAIAAIATNFFHKKAHLYVALH